MDLSQVSIAAVAGLLLSLAFSYIPGVKDWYDQLTPTPKKLVMAGALVLTTIGLLAYRCRAEGGCYGLNAETYITALLAALVTNQSMASITPLSPERRALRKAVAKKNEPTPFLSGDHDPYNRTNQPQ